MNLISARSISLDSTFKRRENIKRFGLPPSSLQPEEKKLIIQTITSFLFQYQIVAEDWDILLYNGRKYVWK